jgi:hypothetical protein
MLLNVLNREIFELKVWKISYVLCHVHLHHFLEWIIFLKIRL